MTVISKIYIFKLKKVTCCENFLGGGGVESTTIDAVRVSQEFSSLYKQTTAKFALN